jgi:hypothetical protein
MNKTLTKMDASKILATVPFEKGFHFYTANGAYIKVTAISLEDFVNKLDTVDADSIAFHYPRGDFQAWIGSTLGDQELSNRLCFIKTEISEENLRKELIKILRNRIAELKRLR